MMKAGGVEAERRTVIVTSNFPPVRGGSCVVYDRLAAYSDGAITVIAPSHDFRTGLPLGGAREHDDAAPYRVWRLPVLRPLEGAQGRRFPPLRALGDVRVMLRLLLTLAWVAAVSRARVLCVGDLVYGGWLIWPARRLLGLRTVVYIHGEELTSGGGGLSEALKQRFVRMADAVVAVSGFARDAAVELARADPRRVTVVLNGVDLRLFRPAPPDPALIARHGLGGRRVVLTVARLVERKGIDMMLRALPAVLADHPNAHYVVVGDGPDRERLAGLAAELGVAGRVTWAGQVSDDDLLRHYAVAELFAMPNRRLANGDDEGFGLVFLEANACGLAVVAGRAGGTGDAVRDGENGLLVDGADPRAVAHAVSRLLSDDALRARLAADGMAAAQSSGWDRRAREFQAVVAKLLESSPAEESAQLSTGSRPAPGRLAMPPRRLMADLSAIDRPLLLVLVDAEEEFDWHQISSAATSVRSMRHQVRAHRIFERHGLKPTYLIDYPVVSQPDGFRPLQELVESGAAEVGAQLHPWVSPPIEEAVSEWTSFPGNLPAPLERAKIARLTREIEDRFGRHPCVYRAGRYGAGAATAAILTELGYRIDCSVLPHNDFSAVGGPDYSDWTSCPTWLDPGRRLLELPATVGFAGRFSRAGDRMYRGISLAGPTRLRVPGVFARLGLLERIKLTPEGTSPNEAKRLTRAMLADGHKVFAVTYHSPSLEVGHTPYVRSQADLARFLDWLDQYCGWFMGEIGGRPGTAGEVRALAEGYVPAPQNPPE